MYEFFELMSLCTIGTSLGGLKKPFLQMILFIPAITRQLHCLYNYIFDELFDAWGLQNILKHNLEPVELIGTETQRIFNTQKIISVATLSCPYFRNSDLRVYLRWD